MPWCCRELSRLKNCKNYLFKKYQKSGLANDYARYVAARYNYTKCNKTSYENYLNSVKKNLKADPKTFFNFVNLKRRSQTFPSRMKLNNCDEANCDISISNLFAKFFQESYNCDTYSCGNNYPFTVPCCNFIGVPVITADDILCNIRSTKLSFCAGPDKIPNSVLKFCANSLVTPLKYLFNLSLRAEIFPDVWKDSFVMPLHKKGSKTEISNYRGIAKLNSIPKLFEKIVTVHIVHSVAPIISTAQHGFTKGRSINTNLLEFTKNAIGGFANGCQTDVIYTDFSKAFDSVNHDLLSFKLDKIGFPPALIGWLRSYLLCRTQRVLFNGIISNAITVSSGVPQGSHLGPILFILFLNDLPAVINRVNILAYADDIKLYTCVTDVNCCHRLQADLSYMSKWCDVNMLILNCDKCKCMSFSRRQIITFNYQINNVFLDRVFLFEDLGITLDPKLNFNAHVDKITNKAKAMLGFVKRWSKEFADPYTTKLLYTSLVRPGLEYGCIIWNPSYNIYSDRIESVQKQFLLFALRHLRWNQNENLPSYVSRLKLIDLPTLHSRRSMLSVLFLHKLIIGDVQSNFLLSCINFNVPSRLSRNFVPIYLNLCRYNFTLHEPFRVICSKYNALSQLFNFSDPLSKIRDCLLYELNRFVFAN